MLEIGHSIAASEHLFDVGLIAGSGIGRLRIMRGGRITAAKAIILL
ncbi:hypothetical protein [Nonomuraea sp. NPDC049480]